MHQDNDGHIHVSEEEASGGSKEGVVRWVLLGGLLLAILLLSAVWIIPAMTQDNIESQGDVGGRMQALEDDGDATDSIITGNVAPPEATVEEAPVPADSE